MSKWIRLGEQHIFNTDKIKYCYINDKKNITVIFFDDEEFVLKPKENLGSIIIFDKESNTHNLKLGYYDTLKVLDNLDESTLVLLIVVVDLPLKSLELNPNISIRSLTLVYPQLLPEVVYPNLNNTSFIQVLDLIVSMNSLSEELIILFIILFNLSS